MFDNLDIFEAYNEYSNYPHKEKEKILKYMLLVYDKNSPYVRSYANITDRKHAAMIAVGLPKEEQYFKDIMNLNCVEFLNLLTLFLQKIQSNYTYERMISDIEVFYEFQKTMREPMDVSCDQEKKIKAINIKSELSEKSKKLEENIKNAFHEIYGSEQFFKLQNEFSNKKMMTPEYIAQNVQKNK